MGIAIRPFKLPVRRRVSTTALVGFLGLVLGIGAFLRSGAYLRYPFSLSLEAALPEKLRLLTPCRSDLDYLRRPEYRLTREIIYEKRCVRGLRSAALSRSTVVHHPTPLFQANSSRVLDLQDACGGALPEEAPCNPITLQVPLPFPKRDYSEFIFGVASSAERLVDSIPQFQHWLGNTRARLLAIVTDRDLSKRQLSRLSARYDEAGIRFTGVRPENVDVGVNEQHFVAVRHLFEHVDNHTKWAVIIDDDTFFPSLFPVAHALSRQDASVAAYVGGLSENSDAVKFHGRMAYGGAGIFLSVPMLRLLEPHVDSCLNESVKREGDGMLKYCVDTKTDANFTEVDGLRQLDFGGDLSGFYESGKLPLSLHHWKTWHQAPVDKMSKIAKFCGGCLFQRWRFGADTVLANGYSIAVYKGGTKKLKLSQMEATFDQYHGGGGSEWEWSLGPMRKHLRADEKKSYVLVDSERVGHHLRQVYVHRAQDPKTQGEQLRDEVFELWWDWK